MPNPGKGEHGRARRPDRIFTERIFLAGLLVIFIIMTIWIMALPYDPMNGDIADATTNAIWKEYYKEGKFAVPYDQWKADKRPDTQSVVVMFGGKPYVVNEKGPVHALFLVVLGPAAGTFFAAIATMSTYMLGRRVFGWQVGAVASLLVLTNLSIMAMWYKDYWVDASTVHLLILSMFLFVESGIRMKVYLEKKERTSLLSSAIIGLGGGLAFGASIGTRYTVAIVVVPVIVYIFAVFWKHMVRSVKKRDLKAVGRNIKHMTMYLLPFVLGLLLVLIPLMSYNNTYFGGPFRSGYDATSLMDYSRSQGHINPRNQTDYLSGDPSGKIGYILHNSVALAPVIFIHMMCLLFVPIAMWKLWKRPIFYLLFLWGLLIMLGFYSMSWVDKYANIPLIPWEPRYQMPALAPFALLGAYGICAVARAIKHGTGPKWKDVKGPLFAIIVVGIIMFLNILPMEGSFREVRAGNLVQGNPPGPGQPPVVTIKQLHIGGKQFVQKLVAVRMAKIISMVNDSNGNVQRFDIQDQSSPPTLAVTPINFSPGTLTNITVGDKVTIIGMFQWQDADNDQIIDPGEPVLTVKNGTMDRIIIEG